jgi:hypothetical protein
MKRLLFLAAAFMATGTVAFAQQMEPVEHPQRLVIPLRPTTGDRPAMPSNESLKGGATPQEVQDYLWYSQILPRPMQGGDSNRYDLIFPVSFGGGTEFRGAGQIFAPSVLYSYYNGKPYTEESSWISGRQNSPFGSDLEYIEQFRGAGDFTIDEIVLLFFENPTGPSPSPIVANVYKIPKNYNATTDFTGSTYKRVGFQALAENLEDQGLLVHQAEIDDIGLDSTIANDLINPTDLIFDTPLQFTKDEAAMVVVSSPVADANTEPPPTDGDYTYLIAYDEYEKGYVTTDPNNPNAVIDTRSNPLDSFKTFGVVQFKRNDSNMIYSAWNALVSVRTNSQGVEEQVPVRLNTNMIFVGRVDLASGVSYHFGKDINEQGLGSVTPNPVTTDARLPFSLKERAHVTMEVFNSAGEAVKKLVDYTYIPGNYSVVLPVSDLRSGAYVVRMTANEKVYTTKLTVAR